MAQDSGASLQTVEKAIEVLQDVVAAPTPVGVTEVARRLGINPSTTYRILNTFKAYNLVEQEEHTSRYRPAIGLLRLCGPALASFDLRR
ncbi:MAG TPA: helix-turn-helix domain-containing protein, partial [Limnochordia bacterium]|nr:helix-turn-helix domain-containing protein [Limnochordia bacterium]